MTIGGRRCKITKREAIVTQMVDKSAGADLRATKMLAQGRRRGTAADKEVVQQFVARLRRQILQEIGEAKAAEPSG